MTRRNPIANAIALLFFGVLSLMVIDASLILCVLREDKRINHVEELQTDERKEINALKLEPEARWARLTINELHEQIEELKAAEKKFHGKQLKEGIEHARSH